MSRRNRNLLPLATMAATLCVTLPAHTNGPDSAIAISARVLPQARIVLLDAPRAVEIGAADVARGFVETAAPTRVRIQSNSRSGYALDVLPQSDWFTSVSVSGVGTGIHFGSGGGTIVQRWARSGTVSLELGFQFALAANVQPGRYPLPLLLQVRPLESL